MSNQLNVIVRRMKLEDLKPADYNPRVISEKAFDGLGKSLERFGVLSYIVWNERTGNIVGGHQRYKQLVENGETETDVVVVDLDDNEEVALNITLNNPNIRGDFTPEVLEQLRLTEAKMGNVFDQLGMMDLYGILKDRGFEKQLQKKKDKLDRIKEPKEERPKDKPEKEDKEVKAPEKAQAVITCPKCRSQWQLTDNKVVFNAVTGTGKPVGGK